MLAIRPGARLGSYEILRVLGSGGMGVVYEARHEALGRRVAIKVLHTLPPGAPKAAVSRARFLREGRAAAQVRHEHVVDVFDFGVHDETPFLVMELVEGESLAERLEREGALSLQAALELLLPIVSGVSDLHAAGIIHRDLKPGNILLGRGRSGEVSPKVADFGVSRADDDSPGLTESGAVVGSYAYMAPEQARASKSATEQADQYALGAVLYECVTGARPFEGESPYDLTHAILHAPLIAPTARNPELPHALDAVLARALNRDPGSRFACVEDLGAALLPFAGFELAARWAGEFLPSNAVKVRTLGTTIPPVTSAFLHPAAPARRTWRAVIAVVGLMCIGTLVGVAFVRERERRHDDATASARAPTEPLLTTSATVSGVEPNALPVVASAASVALPVASAPAQARPKAPTAVRTKSAAAPRSDRDPAHDEPAPLDNGAPLLDPR